jgi:hypothetical protein
MDHFLRFFFLQQETSFSTYNLPKASPMVPLTVCKALSSSGLCLIAPVNVFP